MWSWLARILPQMEQTALYELGKIGEDAPMDGSWAAIGTQVPSYLLPQRRQLPTATHRLR